MHKLCTLCNLCKLLHSYVIYAFCVTDCIIMQIMNIPCIFLHSGQNLVNYNRDVNYASKPGLVPGTNPGLDA